MPPREREGPAATPDSGPIQNFSSYDTTDKHSLGHPGDMNPADCLTAEAIAMRELRATVIDATDIGTYAIEYAVNGWQVGPLCSKDRRSVYGKEPTTGLTPNGLLDFTTDIDTVARWWSRAPYNIGARVPASMFVLDVDGPDRRPHPGRGLEALAKLEDQYGPLPPTHTSSCPATIRHGCLFVYSSNTPFEVTEAGNAHGYTKFRAYAVLNHDGDMSAAARALMAAA